MNRPMKAAYIVLGLALALRVVDIFVLRLDELWGEIILSKTLGFLLVIAYVRTVRLSMSDVGFHTRGLYPAVSLAFVGACAVMALAYATQLIALWQAGVPASLTFAAIDPKSGMVGGAAFALWLVAGNVINSLCEEGLFRGVLLTRLAERQTFWKANLVQALLFSGWHLVWPLKAWISGAASPAGAAAEAGLLSLATLIAALVYGYLYGRTGNLWAPWIMHTINNTALNLVHVQTAAGIEEGVTLLNVMAVVGLIPFAYAVKRIGGDRPIPRGLSIDGN